MEPVLQDTLVITRHAVETDGQPLRYTVATGYLPLREESRKRWANVFFIAYIRDGSVDVAGRQPHAPRPDCAATSR